MRLPRLSKALISISLALLFAFISIMKLPQAALSFVYSSVASRVEPQLEMMVANNSQDVVARFEERFTCLRTKQIPLEKFQSYSQQEIRKIVVRLARELAPCINQNGITGVNPDTLVGVIFTSEVAGNFGVVVVAAGPKQTNIAQGNQRNQGNQNGGNLEEPLPGSTTNGAPNNGVTVIITNAKDVDGTPYTIGQSVNLNAVARAGGQDISNTIVWQNIEGQTIGRGTNLNYAAAVTKNETITAKAKAPDGRENWYMVSFTVSSKDAPIAPHVKVVQNPPNATKEVVLGWDSQRQLICLRDDDALRTKVVGGDNLVFWYGPEEILKQADHPPMVIDSIKDPIKRVIPPIQVGKRIEPTQIGIANYPPNTNCFEGAKVLSDPSDLFGGPIRNRSFTPPEPIDFTKSKYISPITCEDVLEGNLDLFDSLDLRGIRAKDAEQVCSQKDRNRPNGERDLTIGAREVRDGLPDYVTNAENDTQVQGSCQGVAPGAVDIVFQPDDQSFSGEYELTADGFLSNYNGSKTDLKPFLIDAGVKPEDFLSGKVREFSADIDRNGYKDEVTLEQTPQSCAPPNMGDADDPVFNIPIKEYTINIIDWKKDTLEKNKERETQVVGNKQKNTNYETTSTKREAYAVKSDAYIGFGFKPRMSGDLDFKPFKIRVETGATGVFKGGITLDALYVLEYKKEWTLLRVDGPSAPRIAFSIGPIPVWIAAYLQLPLKLNKPVYNSPTGVAACIREGVLGFKAGADLNVKVPGGFDKPKTFTKPVSGGQAALEGRATVTVAPRLQLLLYDVAGPALNVGGEAIAQTALPKTTLNIIKPLPNQEYTTNDQIQFEASIQTVAPPEIQFLRRFYADIELISASETLFPPFELRLVPSMCFEAPKVCAFGECIGGQEYCTAPISISFDLAGWLKDKFSIPGYRSEPPDGMLIGKVNLPELKGASLGCPRVVWETDTYNLAIDRTSKERALEAVNRANSQLISRTVTLPAGSLPKGTHRITAKAYSPFVLQESPLLGSSQPVEFKIKEN